MNLIYKYGMAKMFFIEFKSSDDKEFLGYFYCFS